LTVFPEGSDLVFLTVDYGRNNAERLSLREGFDSCGTGRLAAQDGNHLVRRGLGSEVHVLRGEFAAVVVTVQKVSDDATYSEQRRSLAGEKLTEGVYRLGKRNIGFNAVKSFFHGFHELPEI
jgi:hypothetical protein